MPAEPAPAVPADAGRAAGELFGAADTSWRGRPALGEYRVVDSGEGLDGLARALADTHDWVAFDTETTGLNPLEAEVVGISVSLEPGRGFYLPVGHEPGPNLDPAAVRRALGPFFAAAGKKRVAQNAKYDWHVLHRFGVPVRDVAFDTMIAAYLVDPDQPKNMDHLARTRLGVEKIPTEALIGPRGGKQLSMAALPVSRVAEYCCEDSDVCLRLVPVLTRELDTLGLTALCEEVETPLIGVLVRMERIGVRVETETLEAMSR
ncbi:MAG TPA: hypothetical protein VID50_08035, partial [Candidatus Eisenbacteria bacterium]